MTFVQGVAPPYIYLIIPVGHADIIIILFMYLPLNQEPLVVLVHVIYSINQNQTILSSS